ncbi:hypothetical protein V1525DRAFT_414014 [Lipomyces kononenkoae]|uniref:Uncharacterized protein n=1 Tax=Lipomyces kononenkoae TaxID=34357 RepID=A0ACC3SRB4_LIPKO
MHSPDSYISTLSTLPALLCPTAVFVMTALLLRRRIQTHGPIPIAATLIKFNNSFYATVSLWLLCGILLSRMTTSHSVESAFWMLPTDAHCRLAYHLSKFYEYFDIFLVLASGGQIALHFGFHHFTTPVLTYVRVLRHHDGWEPFAILNLLHHVLMYAYFGGMSAFRPILRWTGALQLVVGILAEIRIMSMKLADEDVVWPNMISCLLLTCYMLLFVREIRMEDAEKAAKGSTSEEDSGNGSEERLKVE